MKIDQYLKDHSLTDDQFAAQVGADRSAVTRWRNGTTIPSPARQVRIFEVTGGLVSPNDFMPAPATLAPAEPSTEAA